MKVVKFERGKYILSNGLEFDTQDQVKAFIQGIQFAQANMDIALNTLINNACRELK